MQLKNSTFLSLNIKDRWQNKTYMCHQTSVPNYPPFRTIFKKFLKMQHFLGHTRLQFLQAILAMQQKCQIWSCFQSSGWLNIFSIKTTVLRFHPIRRRTQRNIWSIGGFAGNKMIFSLFVPAAANINNDEDDEDEEQDNYRQPNVQWVHLEFICEEKQDKTTENQSVPLTHWCHKCLFFLQPICRNTNTN